MTYRLMLPLLAALALPACGKNDDSSAKNKPSGGGDGDKSKPVKIDPSLSWPEQTGPTFAVKAPRAASESKGTSKDPLVDSVTIYTGYEPAGAPGDFKITVTKFTDKAATADPLKIMRDAIKEPTQSMPGTKTDDTDCIVGDPPAMEGVYTGTDPKLGEFKMRQRSYYRDLTLWTIQARYTASNKDFGAQAQTFVDSFKVTVAALPKPEPVPAPPPK
jgi:hypothetical protein